MKTFRINYEETFGGTFYVEAENEEKAREYFEHLVAEEKIDVGDLEMLDSRLDVAPYV